MKILVAAVVMATMLAGPAFAQAEKMGTNTRTPDEASQEARAAKNRADVEKQYNETMKRMRTQGPAPKSDPWGSVRPAASADGKR